MTNVIRVTVTVDTDELRRWADRLADAGAHGPAHVLYKAALDGESLTEQALRAARLEERERVARAIEDHAANCGRTGPHHATFATAVRIARSADPLADHPAGAE